MKSRINTVRVSFLSLTIFILGICLSYIAAEHLTQKVTCLTWESNKCTSTISEMGSPLDLLVWFSLGALLSLVAARVFFTSMNYSET